jgi:hypothetical protein
MDVGTHQCFNNSSLETEVNFKTFSYYVTVK